MKNIYMILFFAFMLNVLANAQSTIYFFYPSTGKTEVPLNIKFNNEDAFLLKQKQKKVCTMKTEGKLIVSFGGSFMVAGKTNVLTTQRGSSRTNQWGDEIQLDLTDGSFHYIKLKMSNGGRNMSFQVLTDAEGAVEMFAKSYKDTFAYNEP